MGMHNHKLLRDCREANSRDTSPRHACLGEVSRKIWLHDFAINNNGGSVPVIFISLGKLTRSRFNSRNLPVFLQGFYQVSALIY